MAVSSDAAAAGQHGGCIYYESPRIVVTSHIIEISRGRYVVREVRRIERVEVFAHPARTVASICGGIELLLAAALAAAFGVAVFLCAGFLTAVGLAVAILVDGRRNPRWMILRGVYRGQAIVLFSSRDQREFGQVRRAVIRAVEDSRPPGL
jgi:hypothetical protein